GRNARSASQPLLPPCCATWQGLFFEQVLPRGCRSLGQRGEENGRAFAPCLNAMRQVPHQFACGGEVRLIPGKNAHKRSASRPRSGEIPASSRREPGGEATARPPGSMTLSGRILPFLALGAIVLVSYATSLGTGFTLDSSLIIRGAERVHVASWANVKQI